MIYKSEQIKAFMANRVTQTRLWVVFVFNAYSA